MQFLGLKIGHKILIISFELFGKIRFSSSTKRKNIHRGFKISSFGTHIISVRKLFLMFFICLHSLHSDLNSVLYDTLNSVMHNCLVLTGAFYLHVHPNYCMDGWHYWIQFFIGNLLAELILAIYTGTSTRHVNYMHHHLLYLSIFIQMYVTKTTCFWYNTTPLRFYAQLFSNHTIFRVVLSKYDGDFNYCYVL